LLSVGYVLWTIPGGWLISGILTQMPAWRLTEPLVVRDYLDAELSDEDDLLQSFLERDEDKQDAPVASKTKSA